MLRPATPLSILLFISFVLLLISVLSAPVVRSIPLGSYEGINLGVFGYCRQNGPCSGLSVGYKSSTLFSNQNGFNLMAGSRDSLSSLLIVHPVAALCNLIVLGLAVAAHFHSPSHSARYLLALLMLLLPTLLVTLLAFLVDIIIFVPHVQWGGWIVLASTILITASGVVTCAMRRTLVSRKARKKRIAENAEMSGENFYNRQEQESKMMPVPTMSTESKVPLVNGSPGADNLPSFASYEASRISGDRQQRSQPFSTGNATPVSPINDESRYYAGPVRSNSRPPPGESGIPLAPINTRRSDSPYRASPDSRGPGPYPPNAYGMRGSYGPPRGRGGFPSRGGYNPRGGFGPRGPPPPQGYGRGGFGPDMRGGYGGRGRGGFTGAPVAAGAVGGAMVSSASRMRGPPPPGYITQDDDASSERYGPRQNFPPPIDTYSSPYARPGSAPYEPVSPSDYNAADENTTTYVAYNPQSQSPVKAASLNSRGQSPSATRRSSSPAPDMPLIGQAVPLDATRGRPTAYNPNEQDTVDMQHNRSHPASPQEDHPQECAFPTDESAPTHHNVTLNDPPVTRPRGTSNASGSYYEDVDPRFAEGADVISALPRRNPNFQQHQPSSQGSWNPQQPGSEGANPSIARSTSYEEIPVGARSPAESDGSHFTSVSQRGVNPNWRPGNGGEFNNFGPRRPQQARQDVLLGNNPDFELVPPSNRFAGRGVHGGFRGGPLGGGGRMPPPEVLGMSGDSPYPAPATMKEI